MSVVIVTFNDREALGRALDSIEAQTLDAGAREIIVVDDGSADGTARMLKEKYPEVEVIETPHTGADNSRALGVARARGETVAFLDSDCTAPADWLERALGSLRGAGAAAVGGRIVHPGGFWARLVGLADFGAYQGGRAADVDTIPTCSMVARRRALLEAGFDPDLDIGGDVILCARLRRGGHRLRYDPSLEVFHHPRVTPGAFLRRAGVYGRGAVLTRRRDPSLPGAAFLRAGAAGVVCLTLGRSLVDWGRLLRHGRRMGLPPWQRAAAAPLLLLRRLFSLGGALRAYYGER